MAEKQMAQQKKMTMTQFANSLADNVLSEFTNRQQKGMALPPNYSPQNALMSAMFKIKETKDRQKQAALSVCTPDSVKQSLMEMLVKGLDPAKTQCYFIVYGNQLTLMESYFGVVHRAKIADPNIKNVFAQVVFEGDTFKYSIQDGVKIVTNHEQDPDNIDLDKIKGAYATIVYKDGDKVSEYMNMKQIQNSWSRGQTKGGSDAHKLAPEEMCKRTVLKRLVKMVTNTSDDAHMLDQMGQFDDVAEEQEATVEIDVTAEDEFQEEQSTPASEPVPEEKPVKSKPAAKKESEEDRQADLSDYIS